MVKGSVDHVLEGAADDSQVCGTYFPPHVQFDEEDDPDMTTRRAVKLLLLMLLVETGLILPRKAEAGAGPRKARKEMRKAGKGLRVLPLVLREDAGAAGSRFTGDIFMVLVCCG
jgi:hypothetical protein|eukprot:evm.model.NODE_12861_length_6286_cov_12.196309.1